ncbi:prenyltransferase/squalene oxidase repeat-containing protein [Anatilimnocola sp. NA78]|uniref:prenyltransferase/squalene oxidase repeat-containing protein n=1 Tax=Anatilimnocola sp. NA78 TaxID=3415683 RepID=UPI003CE50BAA
MQALGRRRFLAASSATALALTASGSATAQQPATERASESLTTDTQRAVDRGLTWLAKRQIGSGTHKGAFGQSGYQGGVAVCSLSGLAFMCSGSAPGQGPFGKNIDRCAEFMCTCVGDTGYISQPNFGQDNMYGHGFGTLFLSEYYGMSDRPDLDATVGEKLRKAVKLTCECQNDAGGWRYEPRKSDADLSITICNIMGLRAARDAGIHVPDPVRSKCIDYVKKSQNSDGGFRYQISSGGGSTFPLTAAGVVSLYSAGIYDGEQVEKALAYLMRYMPGSGSSNTGYFFYGHYYAVQAMWHAGGSHWAKWYPAIREVLLKKQAGDGSWADSEVCPEFGTAMACIILQMPNNFLPIFTP